MYKKYNEYKRKGTCSIFIFTEPLHGFRRVSVREQRTRKDFAEEIRILLEEDYKDAPKVCLVMDNLNTHNIALLYHTFEAKKALELSKRLEIHYTPKHGSWLNIAEIELSAMTSQCLGRRIGSIEILQSELLAWSLSRNKNCKSVNWQFKTEDAHIKSKKLYPEI